MATPTLTLLNHTLLSDADSVTGWVDIIGEDTDIKVEGLSSRNGVLRNDGEQGYYDAGSAPVTAVDKVVRGWISVTTIAYMGTMASDPYKLIAYDGATEEQKAIFGSDTYPGGWFNYVAAMNLFTTLTLANVQRWGVECGHASAARNVTNTWMDAIRYLDGYSMVGGTSIDKVTPADISVVDKVDALNVLYQSPLAEKYFFATGTVQLGEDATTHYFELDGDSIAFLDLPIEAGLYAITGVGSGTDIVIKNGTIFAEGTTDATRFIFDMSDVDLASFLMTAQKIERAALVTFKAGQTVTGNTFHDCLQITPDGADLSDSTISGYEGTVGTAALVYDINADPLGELDGVTFIKGTATTHAIELGPNCPASISLKDWTVTGYNAADAQNDSVIYNNSGKAITVNVSGNTGVISYRNGTSATTVVQNTVTTTIKDVPTGAEWRLYEADPVQGIIGSTELDGAESHTGGDITYADNYSADTNAALQVLASGYVEFLRYFVLGAAPQTITVILEPETNT